jgi:predicted ATPase/class 3 adenylate cyclase
MSQLPTGTVTFVFTDIEGSTSMVQRLGDAFVEVLEHHNRVMREAFNAGVEIRSEGDAFFYVFPSAPNALQAACAAQRGLADVSWPEGATVMVRMGIHTGEGKTGGDDYVGLDVHRAARIAAAGHGGQILVSDATRALSGQSLSADIALIDLGEHRFKDLEQPEHVYQVVIRGLPADFPPIRSLDVAPNNLPTQATAFVGREREAHEVTALLDAGRLVTLTGSGGSGKTRLALHIASEVLREFPGGVYYVPLESLRSADLVVATIAAQLGVTNGVDDSLVETVAGAIGSHPTLLLVDNFEHVLDAAPEVAALLGGAPGLKVMVTSQRPLSIRGEHLYLVPPLATEEAVEMFAGLAAAADPSIELDDDTKSAMHEVVQLLEGIPLALELTAPRVRLFGVLGLRDRLRERTEVPAVGLADLPQRHRTLNDAISWSYHLLDDAGRSLLRQLAVFEGGFTLDGADAVVDEAGVVADGVASLLDRSLLRNQVKRGEVRFSMFDSIRRFALGELDAGERADAARRHADYYVGLAETAGPFLDAEGQRVWLDRLSDEHDNIRAVLRLSRDESDPDTGLLAAGSIWRFYHRRGHLPEGRQWLESLLAMDGSTVEARAIGIEGLAGITYWQGDYEAAKGLYQELLTLYRELGDEVRVADTLFALSTTSGWLGDIEKGLELAEEAKAAYEAAGSSTGAARVSGAIAWGTWQSGRLEEALQLWTEARSVYARLGDEAETRQTDVAIAAVMHQLGGTEEAIALCGATLEAMVEAGDVAGTIEALDFLASITAADGPENALRLAGGADQLRSEAGGGLSADSVGLEPVREIAAAEMDPVAIDAAWDEGKRLSLEEAVALGRAVAARRTSDAKST